MNYYQHRHKNIPPAIIEKWTSQILQDYEAEDLIEFLLEQTAKDKKRWLFDKMAELLQMEANVNTFKAETLEEQSKYEAFILQIKPYYNDRQDFLF
jgi:hypothetical protein